MNRLKDNIISFPLERPWLVILAVVVFLGVAAIQFPRLRVDTDPENMLSAKEPVRVYHEYVKESFDLSDLLVVGIIDTEDPQGVFTAGKLNMIKDIVDEIKNIKGVITRDVIAPSEVDDIQMRQGTLVIEKLQKETLKNDSQAQDIAARAFDNPLLSGKLISTDASQLSIYIPIVEKKESHRIASEIEKIIKKYDTGALQFHITGLPVAEDTFGVEMFKQMASSSPLAMVLVIILIYLSLRKWSLSFVAMAVPLVSILYSMGLLIGLGFPLHIMSSMIPIFIIPITIGDGTHILSAFHDVYQKYHDKKKALRHVLEDLWSPILYTSLTTVAGFASLATTPIPPVQIFGLFTAFGVVCAWIFSLLLLPACIMVMPEGVFLGFGMAHHEDAHDRFAKGVKRIGEFSIRNPRKILIVTLVVLIVSVIGILQIRVNDNPVKWFAPTHKIRVADTLLNRYFGGTYMAYLVFESAQPNSMLEPEMLRYIEDLQKYLEAMPVVGKTSSVVDIIKKISYELRDEDPAYFAVPPTRQAANQYLFLYQNSGDPDDLFKLIDYDYKRTNIWLQLKSGDNVDMSSVIHEVDTYIAGHPLPEHITYNWAGLTYVNVVWQDRMVKGMFHSFMGSFIVVFVLISLMFRSLRLGFLGMIPMTVAVLGIYGFIGLIGKDYDMPVAVLSALTLGLSVDFAIHFLQQCRVKYAQDRDLGAAIMHVFGEPARAITRVVIIVGIAFLPLMLSSLIPYKTVGIFMSAITILSGMSTLVLIPVLISVFGAKWLEPPLRFLSLERAFQLTLGILFLGSFLGAHLVHRWFLSIAFLLCIGLIQSAFTGFCLLKVLLKKAGFK
ncbi:MAG: MMPL family transporter [Candidatus Omnitrophica bacterium]|nr:MMPL family transporter [Candidatus Omnitrophota bacterium]